MKNFRKKLTEFFLASIGLLVIKIFPVKKISEIGFSRGQECVCVRTVDEWLKNWQSFEVGVTGGFGAGEDSFQNYTTTTADDLQKQKLCLSKIWIIDKKQ